MITKEKQNISTRIQSFGPWVKWLVKKEFEEYKATDAYIEMLCPSPKTHNIESSSIHKLETLVKASIKKEFGSRIEHSSSYNLLVNSVMYKLLKSSEKNEDTKA